MAYDIITVTDALLSRSRIRGLSLSNLMLQKLLYYSQAWHLALSDTPLFLDSIEAWIHGPVVPSVFRRFKVFKWEPISIDVPECTNSSLATYLDSIIELYAKSSAKQLEHLTHSEAPWLVARAGLAEDQPSNNVISPEVMRAFYKGLMPARG